MTIKKIFQDWSKKMIAKIMEGARKAPRLSNLKTLFSVELFLSLPTSAAPSVTPASIPANPQFMTQYEIIKKTSELENSMPVVPEMVNADAIMRMDFLPILSDNLPRIIIDTIPQKTPRKKINPIVS